MSLVEVWGKEIKGKLWTVGDIHGCYNLLMNTLKAKGFDFENDLLVAVGDLVDRGIQNLECVQLLDQDWFTSVRGNHEDLCVWGMENAAAMKCHRDNGGAWFYDDLSPADRLWVIDRLSTLPVVLEVNHNGRKYGFVHGHIEQNNWDEFKQTFEYAMEVGRDPSMLAMWGRDRVDTDNDKYTHVSGIDAVFMGHTVMQKPMKRDNCYYIDTGAVHWATMTILDLSEI